MAENTLFFTVLFILLLQCCESFSLTWPSRIKINTCKSQTCHFRMAVIQSTRKSDSTTHDVQKNYRMVFPPRTTPPLIKQESEQLSHTTRRTVLCRPLIGIVLGFTTVVQSKTVLSAHAATASQQVAEDKSKIYQGFVQLNYLLDHWEQETTICGRSGDNPYISKNGCERTPIKVMDYLGYKDIQHPLFKADKTMRRLEPLVPSDREVEFYEAIESWMIAAEEGNGMAYISSWGEANPGGGKDRVQLFIERARKNVIQARDSLSTIVDIFELKEP
jgi:hypothetical protein